nr:probable serine/threonine-protein kinase DDB_G0267514 isoform X2 [Oryza sativa Japonica Group]
MDDLPDDQGQSDAHPSDPNWWSSHAEHKLGSISLTKQERNSGSPGSSHCGEGDHSLWAAQTLWCTGCLSSPIPNGFYSIIPDKKLKERFDTIPSPDDLYSLGIEGFKAEIILVDLEKDKKLSAIKQLCAALVKGLKSNPAAMIKKIAGFLTSINGQIRNSVLQELPLRKFLISWKTVEFNCWGKLDMDLVGPEQYYSKFLQMLLVWIVSCWCQEQDDNNRSFKVPSLRNIMLKSTNSMEGKLRCSSHSEPNVANSFCGRSRRKVVEEHQRTASSSPEHPLSRTRGRSMLGDRQHGDGVAVSRSDGASTSNMRRGRRRSISFTPEIGDDIVSAVRAMSERMRENRLSRGQNDGSPGQLNDSQKNESPHDFNDNELHVRGPDEQEGSRRQVSNQKAVSLPSSPHRLRSDGSGLRGPAEFLTADLMSTWNKVLRSSPFLNKPLLPFEEWHIEFSEITVGTRVGIGFFGEVFRGIWNGTDVAIKLFLEQDLTTENMEDFCNEISILSRLRHPNVILFLGACMKPPHLSLVTEYMEMGSLYYLIHASGQKGKLSWRRRLKMLRDICRGLMCMHRLKIVHRDLKSANCLVNKHWAVKLCDFGLSRVMSNSAMNDNSSAGTPEWMAPELIRNEPFTEKCDIFSLGVIMWELCTLSRPWEGIPSVQVVYNVANEGARLEIPDGPLGSLIADCWAEPDKRPGCQEILTRLLDCEYTLC